MRNETVEFSFFLHKMLNIMEIFLNIWRKKKEKELESVKILHLKCDGIYENASSVQVTSEQRMA